MKTLSAILFGDLKTRLLALALAVVTWVSVYRESTESLTTSAEIEIQKGADVVVMEILDETGKPCSRIDARVSGPRGQRGNLRNLRLRKLVELDPKAQTPQTIAFDVTEETLQLPAKFRLDEAKPRRIQVRVDRLKAVSLRLVAPAGVLPEGVDPLLGLAKGIPAPGFRVKSVKLTPTYASVRGPEGIFAKYQTATVLPVDISGLPAGVHVIPTAIVPTLDGISVTSTTPVQVTVEIAEESLQATFTVGVSLIQSDDYARDFTAEPQDRQVEILVRGPAGAINEIKSRQDLLMAVIDIAAMRPEESRPVDDKGLIATRPIVVQFRGKFAGQDQLEVTVQKPEKAETVVTFRKRAK